MKKIRFTAELITDEDMDIQELLDTIIEVASENCPIGIDECKVIESQLFAESNEKDDVKLTIDGVLNKWAFYEVFNKFVRNWHFKDEKGNQYGYLVMIDKLEKNIYSKEIGKEKSMQFITFKDEWYNEPLKLDNCLKDLYEKYKGNNEIDIELTTIMNFGK